MPKNDAIHKECLQLKANQRKAGPLSRLPALALAAFMLCSAASGSSQAAEAVSTRSATRVQQTGSRIIIEKVIESKAVDLLIVVDDSGSMAPVFSRIKDAIEAMAAGIASLPVDVNLGLVVTSAFNTYSGPGLGRSESDRRLIGTSLPRFANSLSSDFVGNVTAQLSRLLNAGANGQANERPFRVIQRAVSNELATAENTGFRRPGAHFISWVFTDADDESNIPPFDFVSQVRSLTGDLNFSMAAAFAPEGPSTLNCDRSGEPAPDKLTEALRLTNGVAHSLEICDPQLAPKSKAAIESLIQKRVRGPGPSNSIIEPMTLNPWWRVDWRRSRVELGGVELQLGDLSKGYVYNSRTNKIEFGKDIVVPAGSPLLRVELILL